MQRLVLDSLGPDAPFRLEEAPSAPLGPNEVRIAVRAAGINPIDTKIRGGAYGDIANTPVVLGCDLAGEITEIGAAVPGFAPGDHVYGCAGGLIGRDGSYASEMRADHRLLARMPANLSFREAAALPLVTITAWEALIERAKVQPGERVLVHGAAGGVGHVGVQLAHLAGAIVDATASSPDKALIARELGAAHAIEYRSTPVADYVAARTGGAGYDVVFDTIGNANIATSIAAVATNGRVATILARDTALDLGPLMPHNATLHVVFMLVPMLRDRDLERHGDILTRAARLVEAGRLKPLLDPERFTLADAGAAHAKLASGKAVGKLVLDIG
ncbi:MAG: zinc-binding dehydrogenase [Sphingomonas sp.]|uniref:zinc-binding dehydrogenase n=1 Tax=Sphingomonas sp. TaxID=28214 RepID=UPI0025F567E0|nr:zinc-binding dehydrogenase [Sphingomonas sp.]MBX9881317.1 zinc-binding dehydrogenase [Sphingomonas sp.]